jgi:transcriptional regulator NrdR family protein
MEHHLVGYNDANSVNVVASDVEAHLFAIDLLLRWICQAVEASKVDDECLDQSVSDPHEELFHSISLRFKSKFIEHRHCHELCFLILEVK